MDKNQFSAKWHQMKGKVREKWGKLTDNEVEQINGKMENLSGHLQKKYGWAKDKAEHEIHQWGTSFGEHGTTHGKDNMHMGPRDHKEGNTRGMREETYQRSEDRRGDMNHDRQHMNDKKKMHGPDEYKEKKRKAS